MEEQGAEIASEAGQVDEIGDAVALGPTLTQFTTGPGGLVTLAPADADEAGSGGWDVIDDTNHLDGGFLRGEDWLNPDNMWMNLPEEHPVRDSALAVAMGWHRRLGDASLLGGLDPHLLNRIMALSLEAPLRVPQDFATLTDAFEAAVDGQTVFVSRGVHSLVRGASGPTRLTKRLVVVGEPGAELHGGLQLGFESAGVLKSLTIKGYLWVYDGKWQVENCSITNHNDACVVASNGARVRLEECTLGGRPAQRASHGIIAYGDARVQTRNSDFSYCSTALVTGGRCRAALRDCDVKDCESAFSVLRPGAAGFSIHISGSGSTSAALYI